MGNHGEGVHIKKTAVGGCVKLLVKILVNIRAKVGTSWQKTLVQFWKISIANVIAIEPLETLKSLQPTNLT